MVRRGDFAVRWRLLTTLSNEDRRREEGEEEEEKEGEGRSPPTVGIRTEETSERGSRPFFEGMGEREGRGSEMKREKVV